MLSKHVITTSKIYPVNIIFYQGVKYNNCGITQNMHMLYLCNTYYNSWD